MKPNKLSRFLSLVLRHDPGQINLQLNAEGWAEVDHLLSQLNAHGKRITHEMIEAVVHDNDQTRFRFSEDGLFIRANQGHSIDIELSLSPCTPPEYLYHGTADRFLKSIKLKGLNSRPSQHVHLSADLAAATKIGMRHGRPAILLIEAKRMFADGFDFFLTDQEVWLTKEVPLAYLERQA